MSDKEKRYAVLDKFYAQQYGSMEPPSVVDGKVIDAMADRIVELEAAVERVLALHHNRMRGSYTCAECRDDYPCPTLRALEVGP